MSWGAYAMLRASMRPDPPGAERDRLAMRLAGAEAVAARESAFPLMTGENAGEAIAFQEARQREAYARITTDGRSVEALRVALGSR